MKVQPWDRWPIRAGRIYPIRGREVRTIRETREVWAFPTVVLVGEVLRDLPACDLPVPVAAGFQTISRIEIKSSDEPDFSLKAGAERSFILTLPGNLVDDATKVRCLQRGLSTIAAQNRDSLLTLIESSTHTLNNHANEIMGLLFLLEIKAPGIRAALSADNLCVNYKQCLDIFKSARQPAAGVDLLDARIAQVEQGLLQLKAWFDEIDAVLGALSVSANEYLQSKFIRIGPNIAEAQKVIVRTAAALADLGQLSALKPISLEETIFLKRLITDFLPKRKDVFLYKIWGNAIILCEIFDEIIANARRATKQSGLDGMRLEVDVLEEKGMIRMTLFNKVNDAEMERFVAEEAGRLFTLVIDPQDEHTKQFIFKQGVSSRSSGGGTGLAVLWERVVLRLQGEVEANYHPEQNEFLLAVSLRLVQDNQI